MSSTSKCALVGLHLKSESSIDGKKSNIGKMKTSDLDRLNDQIHDETR